MKILITGVTGFVGQNLVRFLDNKFAIDGISVRYTADQDFEIDSDVVIHLAGKAHDLKKTSAPKDYYDANFELTKSLYKSFLASKAKKFIYLSSVKAIADTVDEVLTEDAVANPQTHYGKSKWEAEKYITQQSLPGDKFYYILRPCMIHGAGNKGNLNLLYKFVQKGLPYPLAAFDNKRSFLSIDNLCFGIEQLMLQPVASGVYQFADDEALSTNELISLIGQSLSAKVKLWSVPKGLINTLAKVGDVAKLPLNSERLKKLTEDYIVSNEKIVKAIGKPFPVSAKEGLIKTFNSFK